MSISEENVRIEQQRLQRLGDVELLEVENQWGRGFPRPPTPKQQMAMQREKDRRRLDFGPLKPFRGANLPAPSVRELEGANRLSLIFGLLSWIDLFRPPKTEQGVVTDKQVTHTTWENSQSGTGEKWSFHAVAFGKRFKVTDLIERWLNVGDEVVIQYYPLSKTVRKVAKVKLAGDAEIHLNKGVGLASRGQPQEAVSEFDEAIRENPRYDLAYWERGNAYDTLGKHQEALKDFDQAIRLNRQQADYYNTRGCAYLELNQPQSALRDFDEAVRLIPQDPMNYLNRGTVHDDLEQYQMAIDDAGEAIRLDPKLGAAYQNRALSRASIGQDSEARRDLNRAVKLGLDRAELEKLIEERRKHR